MPGVEPKLKPLLPPVGAAPTLNPALGEPKLGEEAPNAPTGVAVAAAAPSGDAACVPHGDAIGAPNGDAAVVPNTGAAAAPPLDWCAHRSSSSD